MRADADDESLTIEEAATPGETSDATVVGGSSRVEEPAVLDLAAHHVDQQYRDDLGGQRLHHGPGVEERLAKIESTVSGLGRTQQTQQKMLESLLGTVDRFRIRSQS